MKYDFDRKTRWLSIIFKKCYAFYESWDDHLQLFYIDNNLIECKSDLHEITLFFHSFSLAWLFSIWLFMIYTTTCTTKIRFILENKTTFCMLGICKHLLVLISATLIRIAKVEVAFTKCEKCYDKGIQRI